MSKGFTFICGDDDYLVNEAGKAAFAEMSASLSEDFGIEIVSGSAQKVDDVENAVARVISSVQTLSLFGDRKAVWLKGVTFLDESRTSTSEGAKAAVEQLTKVLLDVDSANVSLLITANEPDRRRKEFKWFQAHSQFTDLKGASEPGALARLVTEHAKALGCRIEPGAIEVLLGKVGGNSRLLVSELQKLANYVADTQEPITERIVQALVPDARESDFFEPVEVFFSGDLDATLDALRRHFFGNKDARGLLSSLLNRGRLLLQLRALMDSGDAPFNARGFNKGAFENAASRYAAAFAGHAEKTSSDVFSQNPYYLARLFPQATRFTTRQLTQIQLEIVTAFEHSLERHDDHHGVMRDFATRCLAHA